MYTPQVGISLGGTARSTYCLPEERRANCIARRGRRAARLATVGLTAHAGWADGSFERIRPILIFQGAGDLKEEMLLELAAASLEADVMWDFSPSAWMNADIFAAYVKGVVGEWGSTRLDGRRTLLLCDACGTTHHTPHVRAVAAEHNIELLIGPANLTGKYQPVDFAIGKQLKYLVGQSFEKWLEKPRNRRRWTRRWGRGRVTLQEKRLLLIKWVAKAWDYMHAHNQKLLSAAWRRTGCGLAADAPHVVEIQGVPDYKIDDLYA